MGCTSSKQIQPKEATAVATRTESQGQRKNKKDKPVVPQKPAENETVDCPELQKRTSLTSAGKSSGEGMITDTDGKSVSIDKLFPVDPLAGHAIDLRPEHPNYCSPREIATNQWYEGEWAGPTPEGIGKLNSPDGTVYEGQLKAGQPHGYGVLSMPDGSKCSGQFEDSAANGYCMYEWPGSEKFWGYWVNNKRCGWGKSIMGEEGDVIYAQYTNGTRNGMGRCFMHSGDHYAGMFKQNDFSGFGIYVWSNGNRYFGNFELSRCQGQGTLIYLDGRTYVGGFEAGKPHGEGTQTWPDGRRYEGGFRNGFQHGTGKYYCTAQAYRMSQWIEGTRVRWIGEDVNCEGVEDHPAVPMPKELDGVPLDGVSFTDDLDRYILGHAKTSGGLDKLLGQQGIEER